MSDFPYEAYYLCYQEPGKAGWFIERVLHDPDDKEYTARIAAKWPEREWAVFDLHRDYAYQITEGSL